MVLLNINQKSQEYLAHQEYYYSVLQIKNKKLEES